MGVVTTYQNKMLIVDVTESPTEILFLLRGKSVDRDPGTFLTPLIQQTLQQAGPKRLVLDFTRLEYMNSSSVTPIIKLLNELKNGAQSMRLLYSKGHKWQELSFSALKVFQTRDGRIEVIGQ